MSNTIIDIIMILITIILNLSWCMWINYMSSGYVSCGTDDVVISVAGALMGYMMFYTR
jgi:uncharacterized protein YacL